MRCRRKPSSCRLTAQHPQQLPHISALVVASVIAYWINAHGRVRHTDRWAITSARKPRSNQSSPSHPPAVTWCDDARRSSLPRCDSLPAVQLAPAVHSSEHWRVAGLQPHHGIACVVVWLPSAQSRQHLPGDHQHVMQSQFHGVAHGGGLRDALQAETNGLLPY